jgi:cold shock CspA family protein/ribosome-associated translation inhibitor RaiA
MDASPALETLIRARAAELAQFSDRILGCRVVVEPNSKNHRHGNTYHVRVEVSVPGNNVVVSRDPGKDHSHEDPHIAVRAAFDAARRRLQDHMRRMEGETKTHVPPAAGHILRVFAERDYCFLATEDGVEVYVHRNAVAGNHFDRLKVGDRVRYVIDPEEGEHGPQASTVVPL